MPAPATHCTEESLAVVTKGERLELMAAALDRREIDVQRGNAAVLAAFEMRKVTERQC